jgi:hypothetical protein
MGGGIQEAGLLELELKADRTDDRYAAYAKAEANQLCKFIKKIIWMDAGFCQAPEMSPDLFKQSIPMLDKKRKYSLSLSIISD